MKYFSCQPDSHNAFGSLTNGVLTYFTVDCARHTRVSRASGGIDRGEGRRSVAGVPRDIAAKSEAVRAHGFDHGVSSPSPSASSRPNATSAFSKDAYSEAHFSTDTRMHIQRTLTLPSPFQASQCCFSMANRTVFGTDMAFIGAANGLLALVVLREDLLLYVCGKDPQSLREELLRGQRDGTTTGAAASHSSLASSTLGPTAMHRTLGPAALSSSSNYQDFVSPSNLTRPVAASLSSWSSVGVPSTITWMRDKPLVLVGYSSGRVEWYSVSISPARQQELMDPSKETPFGASVTSGAFAYQALNRDSRTSRIARVVTGGHKDGLQTEMVASCQLPDAGALITSDYFPANGTVAVGCEYGGLYLFHTDQLEAPLCEILLSTPMAGFLYCHPFLPLVGIVSSVVWADKEDARRRRAAITPTRAAANSVLARRDQAQEAGLLGGPSRSSPLRRGRQALQESSPGNDAAARLDRHVGWHDEDVLDVPSSRRGRALATGRAASLVKSEAMRSGCVVTLVEYSKEAPPRQLARTWTGDVPLAPTHRLTQVLQHWIGGTTPRYGTFYNFSWKFSFELELVVGNVEEGALRVVRISRTAAPLSTSAAGPVSSFSGHRESTDGPAEADGIDDGASTAGTDRGSSAGASYTTSSTITAGAAAGVSHPHAYCVVQEYNARLPLHSLVNVEYVSAATSALSVLDTTTISADTTAVLGSGGVAGVPSPATVTAFQREAERHRRHSALLAVAAQAAADPRSRLGFSAAASGQLCRLASTFWAGLAVVSLPRHQGGQLSVSARAGKRHCRCSCGDGAGGAVRESFDGDVLDTLYGASGAAGCRTADGAVRVGGGVDNARGVGGDIMAGSGPQLKENALAAAMLQPLRGEYGRAGGGGDGTAGARRYRRNGADASNSSLHAGTDGASSSWLPSSSSASTQQPNQQRRRRRDRGPLAPAITVPSYAARSTRNEIANAVLIAADHPVDLHQRLRIGAGNVSCVVGMNAAGEVASVPIEVRAVATWHEEGSIFVGLGPTTCAADLVSIQGVERVMRRRHAAGFGVSAMANLAAAKKVGGYGSEDVVLLFSYVATLEGVGVVAPTGSVPSMMELLRRPSTRTRRATADVIETQPRLAPRLRMAMQSCVFHDDLRRLLVLQVLGWLPPSLAEEWRASPAAAAEATAGSETPEWLQLPFEATPVLSEENTNAEIERAAAVEVTHARYGKAADLLLRFAHRSPSYRAVATLLQRPSDALAMVHNSNARVCAAFRASLTPWLLVVFYCLCSGVDRQNGDSGSGIRRGVGSPPPRTALPRDLYQHPDLLVWDRVALAIVMEDTTNGAFARVLREVVLPQCNPLQALLLYQGVHLRTCPVMQEIVDCTGDFQLGACLFARVGVLSTAAVLAFPFLLDGVVQSTHAETDAAGRNVVPSFQPTYPREPTAILQDSSKGNGNGDDDDAVNAKGRDTLNTAPTNTTSVSTSPYAYLYGGGGSNNNGGVGSSSQQSSRRASPNAVLTEARSGGLDDVASHTALLLRNSALPPPPLPLSLLPAGDQSSRTYASIPPASSRSGRGSQRHCSSAGQTGAAASTMEGRDGMATGNSWGGLYSACDTTQSGTDTGGGDDGDEDEDEGDEFGDGGGDVADTPWVWWAAAYRSFLDDEQAFVRRTTFDVECQQLRSHACARAAAMARKARSPTGGMSGRGGEGGGAEGTYGVSRYRSPSQRELDTAGRRLMPGADGRMALSVAHRGGAWIPPDGSASSSSLSGSLSLLYNSPGGAVPRGCGRLAGLSQAELVVGEHAMASDAAHDGGYAQDCVCGERHEGTQLIRSLLNLCSTATTRCSVCLEPVRLGSCDVSSAFAWCTSCRHGGHAHHLQEWFRTHRRCPMNGCDCHCDEDSSLF